jgi:hypothetical protein
MPDRDSACGLHLGTLAALLLYFRTDWIYLAVRVQTAKRHQDPDARLALHHSCDDSWRLAGLFLESW